MEIIKNPLGTINTFFFAIKLEDSFPYESSIAFTMSLKPADVSMFWKALKNGEYAHDTTILDNMVTKLVIHYNPTTYRDYPEDLLAVFSTIELSDSPQDRMKKSPSIIAAVKAIAVEAGRSKTGDTNPDKKAAKAAEKARRAAERKEAKARKAAEEEERRKNEEAGGKNSPPHNEDDLGGDEAGGNDDDEDDLGDDDFGDDEAPVGKRARTTACCYTQTEYMSRGAMGTLGVY